MISTCDPSTLPECHTDDNPSKHNTPGVCHCCGRGCDLECPHCGSLDVEPENANPTIDKKGMMEKFRRLMMDAMEKRNTKYYIGCILIATGDPASEGVSLKEYGRQWGMTRGAVSKHCVFICKYLGIEPSASMLSEESREEYRKHNIRKVKL